jgi:hypothetical protein
MALTTVKQILSSKLGQPILVTKGSGSTTSYPRSVWYSGGYPISGTVDLTTANGSTLSSSSVGAIPFSNPISGETKILNMSISAERPGFFVLYDRLWQCSVDNSSLAIDSSLSTTFNIVSPTWPARDNNASTNGEGVILAIETLFGTAGSTDAVITYTNSAGVSGRTGTTSIPITGSAVRGAWHNVGLEDNDTGVRSVQSIVFPTPNTTTCQVNIVAHRVLGTFIIGAPFIPHFIDSINNVIPSIINDSCLSFWYYPYAGQQVAQPINVTINLAQG